MQHEHDEKKRNLKEIEAEKEKREISQSQLVSEETEKGYEADKALKKIDEQMEYFGRALTTKGVIVDLAQLSDDSLQQIQGTHLRAGELPVASLVYYGHDGESDNNGPTSAPTGMNIKITKNSVSAARDMGMSAGGFIDYTYDKETKSWDVVYKENAVVHSASTGAYQVSDLGESGNRFFLWGESNQINYHPTETGGILP